MKNSLKLQKGDVLDLEGYANVLQDNGDKVDIEWQSNGDKSWVWKSNIHKVYRNGKVVYGKIKIFINELE
jgi:hypothetical protein